MSKFGFIQPDKTLEVTINGATYPVVKAGKGIPCLIICLGSPSVRTLPKEFTALFEVYSSDTYWVEDHALDNPESLTMETIIDDIKALGDALNLKKYTIFAHSAYGIVALEFAKKYPDTASGIIMVGTPVNSNPEVARKNDYLFHLEADGERKDLDAQRRARIAEEDLDNLALSERWLREYSYRDAPRYWHIPDFDCSEIWTGITLSSSFIILFSKILPETDVSKNLESVTSPILLIGGVSDYDCCPWMWEEVRNLPKHFTLTLFNQSGHWPHYEEPELFISEIKNWIKTYDIKPIQN